MYSRVHVINSNSKFKIHNLKTERKRGCDNMRLDDYYFVN